MESSPSNDHEQEKIGTLAYQQKAGGNKKKLSKAALFGADDDLHESQVDEQSFEDWMLSPISKKENPTTTNLPLPRKMGGSQQEDAVKGRTLVDITNSCETKSSPSKSLKVCVCYSIII